MIQLFRRAKSSLLVFVAVATIALAPGIASAQTATPIPPTATAVTITINTNNLLTQVNTWTGSLDDVVFLGVAISIAIALLTFIGAQVLNAFRSGGGRDR
jgi:hypothetical protein